MKFVFHYKSSFRFCIILSILVGLSLWLSRYIPDDYFDNVVSPILVVCTTTVCFVGAFIVYKHSDGLRVRKIWAFTMLIWGLADGAYILFWMISPMTVMNMAAYQLSNHELLIAVLLSWSLLLYPTEALRPGWLTVKNALWQLLPMVALVALNYVVPFNMAPIVTLYPLVLTALLLNHVHAYRTWCEENFSTMDDIDVQWILKYQTMLALAGIVFLYMCLTHGHTRGFTQLWLMSFTFIYSTEQILFRRDPWEMIRKDEKASKQVAEPTESNAEYRQILEQWMEKEKPYLDPEFRLMDLTKVLPMNRTYLSQFIHAEYGCTFYQFVNRYRIEEAKRLKLENPDLKAADVSAICGFSSPTVFTRTFISVTGATPRDWSKIATNTP